MFDFKIIADDGVTSFVRASDRETAIKIFCENEGCSKAYVDKHCTVKKMKEDKRYARLKRKIG